MSCNAGKYVKSSVDAKNSVISNKFFNLIETENLVFKNIHDNLINYHYGLTDKYYYENNGLILSIFTDYHLENFKDLNINILQRLQIFERVKKFNNKFTVYLADVNYSKLKFTNYPVGDIILEINDILIDNIDTFKKVVLTPLNKIKTINNETYFV